MLAFTKVKYYSPHEDKKYIELKLYFLAAFAFAPIHHTDKRLSYYILVPVCWTIVRQLVSNHP